MSRNIIYFGLVLFSLTSCSSTPDKPEIHTVEIRDMKFIPEDITVKKGDTILWINQDMVAHDVTEEDTKAWSSSLLPAGKSWKMEVNYESNYFCSIHAVMKGKIRME
ncbi:MAG: plastocyanin/azurin family copper-binding protein [Bacteroidota bacterium]